MATFFVNTLALCLAVCFVSAAATPTYTLTGLDSETTQVNTDNGCELRVDDTPTIKLRTAFCGSNSYTLPASAGVKTYVCANDAGTCESTHNLYEEETFNYDCIPSGTSVTEKTVTLTGCNSEQDSTITVGFVDVTGCQCAYTSIRHVSNSGSDTGLKNFRTST